jgi:uncharacterized integral membrane protein
MPELDEGGGKSRLSGGLIGAGLLAAALAIFVVQNTDDVPVTFFFWTFTGPLWLVLLVSILVGLVALELATSVIRRKRKS